MAPASPSFASVREPVAGGLEHRPFAHVAAASTTTDPAAEPSTARALMKRFELAGTETEKNCCPKTGAGEQPPVVSTPAYIAKESGETPSQGWVFAHEGPASNDSASKRNEAGVVTPDQSRVTNQVPAVGNNPCAYAPVPVLPVATADAVPSQELETVSFGAGDA